MCALREYSKKCLAKWISKQTCITIHLAETWERPLSGLFIWACIEQSFFLKPKSLHKSTLFHGIIERTLLPILSVYTFELFLQVIRWQEQSIWWILMIPIGFVGKKQRIVCRHSYNSHCMQNCTNQTGWALLSRIEL